MKLYCTSHELSVKLVVAGFKQPHPEVGQYWWGKYGRLYIVRWISPDGFPMLCEIGDVGKGRVWDLDEFKEFTFAPSISDFEGDTNIEIVALVKLAYLKSRPNLV